MLSRSNLARTLALLSLAAPCAGAADEEWISVVVNQSNSVEVVDAKQVADFFLGRRLRWAKQVPVLVVVVDGDPILHGAFCEKVLAMSPAQFETRLVAVRYQGAATARVWRAKNEVEARKKVAESPGAIGYVRGKTAVAPLKVVLTLAP